MIAVGSRHALGGSRGHSACVVRSAALEGVGGPVSVLPVYLISSAYPSAPDFPAERVAMPFEFIPVSDSEAQGVLPFPEGSHYARLDSDACVMITC